MQYYAIYCLNSNPPIEMGQRIPEEMIKKAGPERVAELVKKGIISAADPAKAEADRLSRLEEENAGNGATTPIWNFDASELQDKDIDVLNAMIVDRAEDRGLDEIPELFDDREAAIAFMSSEA